jgi:DNA-directed RNA polymerase subunit RPC12/RpoP
MDALKQEYVKYFYLIHGIIPEAMPGAAYRGVSREQQYGRKIIKCPYCGKRLTDTSKDTRVELYRHPLRVQVDCQFYLKCPHCGSEVGINLVV